MLHIKLAAKVVKTSDPFGKGEEFVILEIATKELPPEVHEMINDFFPHTQLAIEKALETESVISSIRAHNGSSK